MVGCAASKRARFALALAVGAWSASVGMVKPRNTVACVAVFRGFPLRLFGRVSYMSRSAAVPSLVGITLISPLISSTMAS